MSDSLINCPHTLDQGRLHKLEALARQATVSTRASSDHLQALYGQQRDAEKHVKNWRDRLTHFARHGSEAENFDDAPAPVSASAIKQGLANAEAKAAEIDALIKEEMKRGEQLSQKSSDALRLVDRCKRAMAELSEESA